MKTVDVRGLSCPEPILNVDEALKTDKELKIIISEPHTRTNIIAHLEKKNIPFTESKEGNDMIIETTNER